MRIIEMEGRKWALAAELVKELGIDKETARRWHRFNKAESVKIGREIAFLIPDESEMDRIRSIFEDWSETGADDQTATVRRWNSDDPMDFEWEIATSKLSDEQKQARERLIEKWKKALANLGIQGKVPGWRIYSRLWYKGNKPAARPQNGRRG